MKPLLLLLASVASAATLALPPAPEPRIVSTTECCEWGSPVPYTGEPPAPTTYPIINAPDGGGLDSLDGRQSVVECPEDGLTAWVGLTLLVFGWRKR